MQMTQWCLFRVAEALEWTLRLAAAYVRWEARAHAECLRRASAGSGDTEGDDE